MKLTRRQAIKAAVVGAGAIAAGAVLPAIPVAPEPVFLADSFAGGGTLLGHYIHSGHWGHPSHLLRSYQQFDELSRGLSGYFGISISDARDRLKERMKIIPGDMYEAYFQLIDVGKNQDA